MITLKLGRLEAQITGTRVVLAGRLDDSVALGDLEPLLPPGPLVIDTAGVTFVNSIGMRSWMRLLRTVRPRVVLEAVADVLITQMNMFSETREVAIASFHAQYVCPACGSESAPLVDARAHAAKLRDLSPPRLPCPECGAGMELGDFPERYLLLFAGAAA